MSRRPIIRTRPTRRRKTKSGPRQLLLLVVAIAIVWGVGYVYDDQAGTDGANPSAGSESAGSESAPTGPIAVPAPALSSSESLALVSALPDAVYTDDGSYSGNREKIGRASCRERVF